METLQNKTVKLSKPTDFNDPFDMYIQESLGLELESFLPGIKQGLLDLITSKLDLDDSRRESFEGKIMTMRTNYRAASSEQKEKFLNELSELSTKELYDPEKLKTRNQEVVSFVLSSFQVDGVFCSTIDKENLLMWAHYADHHRGAVIEFTPSVVKDSFF